MIYWILRRCSPIIVVLICLSAPASARPPIDASIKSQQLLYALQKLHYKNDQTWSVSQSRDVQIRFLYEIDPRGLYLLQKDYDALLAFPLRLKEKPRSAQIFLNRCINVLKIRLAENYAAAVAQRNSKLDFSESGELIQSSSENLRYVRTPAALQKRWQNVHKFNILEKVYSGKDWSDQASFQASIRAAYPVLPEDAILNQQALIDEIRNPSEGFESYIVSIFLNVLARTFDPHSAFFSQNDWRNFQNRLGKSSEGFGLVLRRSITGELSIQRLIPGGPAYKSGQLHKGDIILHLKLPDQGNKLIETTGLRSTRLQDIMSDRRIRRIVLQVRKADGSRRAVRIYKTRIRHEENHVTGFVLQGQQKIGYIYLPAFYVEWDSEAGAATGCANDVASEIFKLKREGIKGLILDLRNNTGGANHEAAQLAGIFLDYGPIFMQQNRSGRVQVVRDRNRGMMFRGPLVVMVNGRSASASEIFAGAMRDYNRAVIVGSQTFGKASGQRVQPLPAHRSGRNFIKVTTNLYFNLKGRSHQGLGLQPDIPLPDATKLLVRENRLYHSFETIRISHKIFYRPMPMQPIQKLFEKSENRVESREAFENIVELVDDLEDMLEDSSSISVQSEDYFKHRSRFQRIYESYNSNRMQASKQFRVHGNSNDLRIEKLDAMIKERNQERRQSIQKDIYVDEAFSIMTDYIPIFKQSKSR